ncbi:MAG: GntR family transcriptional regulator [Kiritimatiellae bacterium]|nr:GntR family transcriptional regulator [Kiritimatiellia bacterium]
MKIDLQVQAADPVHVQIERVLRRRIQKGELAPRQRLPSTDELVSRWRVSRDAVQRALSALARDGWIERKPMRGTFVRAGTQTSYIGVIFNPRLTEENAHFQRAVLRAISVEFENLKDCAWTCRAYDGFRELRSGLSVRQSSACRPLINDLKNYPFAGFIQMLGRGVGRKISGILKNLPAACSGSPLAPLADVALDYEGFGRGSVEYLAGRGLKKIAYFRVGKDDVNDALDVKGVESAARRLEIPKVAVRQMQYDDRETCLQKPAYENMLELMREWGRRKEWPEGLIVSDDIAMYGVAMALAQRGESAIRRLTVVAMANKGINLWYGLPIVRNEFAPDEVARGLIRILSLRIHRKPLPELPVKIPCKLP